MKITAINYNINISPKYLYSSVKYPAMISFTQRPDELSISDKSFNSDNKLDSYYKKLSKNMGILTPADVKKSIKKISSITGISKDEVYAIADRLTAYSSYNSLAHIKNELKKRDVYSISNMARIYSEDEFQEDVVIEFLPGKNFTSDNPTTKTKSKIYSPEKLSSISKTGLPVTLTQVFSYLCRKNLSLCPESWARDDENIAVVLDSNLINLLKTDTKARQDFVDMYVNKNNTKLLYLEDFENGYNFLNNGKNFEDYTIDIINKAKGMQKRNGQSLTNNVRAILNAENIKNLKSLGIPFNLIKPELHEYPDAKDIADNLNPILPTKDEVKQALTCFNHSSNADNIEGNNYVFKFIEQTLFPITPSDYANHMKKLHNKINKIIKDKNISKENVYYIIPDSDKSFILANYQYQKVNNIKNPKNIFINDTSFSTQDYEIDNIPPNSLLVVLDDCIISGMSVIREVFKYPKFARNEYIKNNNISIALASVVSSKAGYLRVQDIINNFNRNGQDKILYSELLPSWDYPENDKDEKYLGLYKDSEYLTSLIFPYMGVDTNCERLVPLYEKFLFSPSAQKAIVDNIEFFY